MLIGQPEVGPSSHVGNRKSSISYKESLIGVIPGAYESAFFGSGMEEDGGDVSDEEEDDEPPEDGEVVIKFPCELKQKIRAPWCTSLIVKVFGRSVGYVFLVNKLKNMWKTSGNFSCVDLGLGFFLIRFESKEGFEDVLKGGPWFIGEHFLSLRPWVPNFRASEASVSSVAVWVRLPELPVEYYHKDSLLQIGSGLGPVLRVDFNTAAGTRGRFARLCIQIDIDKPLTRTMIVGKTRLAVIYEGVGLLCFHCGKIGHRCEWCPIRAPEEIEKPPINDQSKSGMEEDNKLKGFGPWIITQAWAEIAPAIQDKGCLILPLLIDMIWLQEISPFWNFHMDVPRIDGIHCPLRVRCQPSPERRKSEVTQASAASKVHPTFQNVDSVFRSEGNGISNVPICNGSNPEQYVGDVAREGMEFTGVEELAKSLPFDGFLCTNTIGFAGGIWILWKTDAVHVDLLCSIEQELHVSVKVRGSNFLWLLSAIYASPRRKNRILARLNGAQCALAANPSESLFRIEKNLREDYFNILKIEEDFWALKSRVGWVVEGDRNTKFFHTSTLMRRRSNKIVRLRNSVGEWITNSNLIRLHIQRGFVDLFSTSHLHVPSGFSLPSWTPRVSKIEALAISAPISAKDCWNIVGDSVTNEVQQIFTNGRMLAYLNKTLISLIPKCLGPETLTQFRPISLCNTVYKIVTKIIVCKIRPIIGNLVSPYQAAFVPRRRGIDNVIIAQEIIHSMHRKKGKVGQLVLKLDLEKAYDRLEWSFIREVLNFFKFPSSFVNLVLKCVSTSSFSILVNGGQMENFKPSRGIRQGDPLSPYLFILCMEYLSLKILEECDNNSWKGIKASRGGLVFSHLFFADDLLFCAEVSISCCYTISRVLDDFCYHSSQKVSLSKSKVFFSPNVNPNLRHHLCGILRVSRTLNLGKYLGFPLRSNGGSTRDFDFVVEKVQAKLSSWKGKLLSLAGLYATKARNIALLAKLNWRVMEESDSLWAKTLVSKYCPNGIMDEKLVTKRSGSNNWKDPFGPQFIDLCLLWKTLYGFVMLWRVPIADKHVWDSSEGEFSLGKAYSLAWNNFSECTSLKQSSWIWKVRTRPRILFFLWQCYHLSVPIRETLATRGINIPTFCPRCLGPNESLLHVLRDCPDSIAF
uniref:Reverse transcriptase domain-containing protein n=1 Tax=Fagus sylvatica TaxID=28930 RepID=A0A2N9GVI8_FAGSY